MDNLNVRIVELAPMRVASFLGFGPEPERLAFDQLLAWARPKGLLADPEAHPMFGFNNPDPSAGSPNYGYEVWIQVDPDLPAEPGLKLLDVAGGLYAVTRCPVPKGDFETIGRTWRRLVAWREDSPYRCGGGHCLERSLPIASPDLEFVLDLYLSIRT
jgi:DNA gyrase inhibitor GyrI